MSWDPAATNALLWVGAMIVVLVIVFALRRRMPDAPPQIEIYSDAAWGPALEQGERAEVHGVAYEAPGLLLAAAPAAIRPGATTWQLALTGRGTFLMARVGLSGLTDRTRFPVGAVLVARVAAEGAYRVALDLRLAGKPRKLRGVPRAFWQALADAHRLSAG